MEEKAIKFAALVLLILTVVVCCVGPQLPALHTWAVEQEEKQLAEAEFAEEKTQMNHLEIKSTEVTEDSKQRQLRLTLPQGVTGGEVAVTNNYITQTIRIEIPETDGDYFDNYPITGSSNHIDHLSYVQEQEEGIIEITMDQVYELDMDYDDDYFYFDFISPHDIYEKVVVIDAGHGGRAPGATKQGINEKDIDLAILLELKAIFEESDENIGVYYTRIDDSNPTFDQRVQLANKSGADLFISIHNNSTRSGRMSRTSGTQVMYSESDTGRNTSMDFARICLEEVTSELGSKNKGLIAGDDIYIIRTSDVPVALIEVGFMTNQEELEQLNSQPYQEKTAEAIYQSILRAFEEGY